MQQLQPYSGKLQQFYRQPKVYLSLPSKGKWFPPNGIEGDPDNLPVFGMTAMDEIMVKTPDALFSGESTVSVIKSCIPNIKDPWNLSQIDIDSVLIAIRIATYGDKLDLSVTCNECKEEFSLQCDLTPLLSHFATLEFDETVDIEPLTFILRPFTYKEGSNMAIEAYKIQKMLLDAAKNIEERESKSLDGFYKQLAKLTGDSMKKQIVGISIDEEVITNQQEISDFLNNSEQNFFKGVKAHLDSMKERWTLPKQHVTCPECESNQQVLIDLDNSNFFAQG
jgi:hypothetical protein